MTTTDEPKIETVDAKVAAKLFKRDSAPYVHGPFGPPTPPTVQKAIDDGQLYATLMGDEPHVLVTCNLMKSGSTHLDFSQNEIKIKAGELFANNVAKAPSALDQDVGDLLDNIQSRHQTAMWVEIYEEDIAKRRVIEDSDFAYRGTKVNAYGDLTGMYYRPWPTVQLADVDVPDYDQATLTKLIPGFIDASECSKILQELRDFAEWWSAYSGEKVWADHYSTYNKNNTWSAFSLRNFEHDDPTSIVKPREMPRKWKDEHPELMDNVIGNSIAMEHFPSVMAVLERMQGWGIAFDFERVRLMRLTAKGGELQRHSDITDRFAGTKDGLVSRLHIPLVTTEQVEFSMWTHRGDKIQRYLSPLDLWYLDMRKPHAAVNKSQDCERVHLVIDVVSRVELRNYITEAYAKEATVKWP